MTSIKRPILRYHGGKWLLAKWIIPYFPQHSIYTEIFGGAASVLLQKSRSKGEVYNDLFEDVVNVFRVLRDDKKATELCKQIELTPFAREEFNHANPEAYSNSNDIEKARLSILRSFMGFGAGSIFMGENTGFRANSNRSGSTPARDWCNYPEQIKLYCERLKGVIIERRPAVDVLNQHDSQDTLHYVDPPYVSSTRNMKHGYAFDMNDQDHIDLSKALKNAKGMIVLSGYECELYLELYKGWQKIKKKTFADGARPREECLWLNPSASARQNLKLFDIYN